MRCTLLTRSRHLESSKKELLGLTTNCDIIRSIYLRHRPLARHLQREQKRKLAVIGLVRARRSRAARKPNFARIGISGLKAGLGRR